MKKSISIALFFLVIIFSIIYFSNNSIKNSRKDYEKYITSLAKNNSENEYKETAKGEVKEEKEGEGEKSVDEPDMAALQNYIMTIDPNEKRVPTERLMEAFKKTKAIKSRNQNKTDQIIWENVPANMGGRTRAFMFDPNDEAKQKAWAGSVTGGLWCNLNVTSVSSPWVPVNDFWDNLTVSSIAYDPNNTQTFYVGTGEGQTALKIYRESSGVGVGIWKSTNGGSIWSLLPSTSDFKYVTDIVVRNEGGTSVIYAGVISGKYHEANHLSNPSDGLYRSADNGLTWEQVLPNIAGLSTPYSVSDIELTQNNRIVIGTMQNIDRQGGGVILYSDLGTKGSWTEYNDLSNLIKQQTDFNLPGRIVLSAAPSDKNIIYAAVAAGYFTPSDGFSVFHGKYIIKSENNGSTWVQKTLPTPQQGIINWAYIAWHALVIKVSPDNPDVVLAGGLDINRSTDGGATWTRISDWTGMYYFTSNYVHADIHSIQFRPGSTKEVYATTDGGVFYTSDYSIDSPTFSEMNKNFNTLQFYSCDISKNVDQNYFAGGLQDNGSLFYKGSPITVTDMVSGGDGALCFFDEDGMLITASQYNNWYFLYDNYQSESYYQGSGGGSVFVNPADYDSNNNTLYTNGVTFSGQLPGVICRISGIPLSPTGELLQLTTGNTAFFSAIKYSPYSNTISKTLIAGTAAGQLFRITNAQATPVAVEIGSNQFPNGYISSIAIGESINKLLVTFSNYGVSSVWQTNNGGSSWVEKEGNLPDMPIRYALYNPKNYNEVMIATELGVWATRDINAQNVEWVPELNGLANVRVDMMKIRAADNRIILASHGRGLYTGIWESFGTGVEDLQNNEIKLYPNPANEQFNISINDLPFGEYIIQLTNSNGVIVYSKPLDNQKQLTIITADYASGLYYLTIKGSKYNKTGKVIIKH